MIPLEEIFPVSSFARKRCADPVLDTGRDEADRLRRLRFFADYKKNVGTAALSRRAELLYFIERYLIERQMRGEWSNIARLPANDLGRNVPNDSRAMNAGLSVRANEVFESLRNAPNAATAFAGSTEQLDDLRR